MVTRDNYVLTLKDNQQLHGFTWTSKKEDKIKANIIIVTGMEETCIRYDSFAKFLAEDGYNIYSVDHYGQGENVEADLSNLGVWPHDGFKKMVDNIAYFANLIKQDGLPLYIFAHSMGSFMMQSFLQRYPDVANKVVLCGTGAPQTLMAKLGHFMARLTSSEKTRNVKSKFINHLMFGSFNNKVENPKTDFDWLSENEDNVNVYIADPKCGFGPNKGFCVEFLKGLSTCWTKKGLANLSKDTKILLIGGKGDPVTGYGKSPKVMKELYLDHGVKEVEAIVYNHARHEILNEKDEIKFKVYKDVLDFFNK